MSIFIVRHGETGGNASGIVQFPDTPLNQRGEGQAQRVGQRLAALGVKRIIASDYARAKMTAEYIQQAADVPLSFNALLRERHFGDLRGRNHAEIGDLNHPELAPPNGETWPQFHRRIDAAWAEVSAAAVGHSDPIAIVTHGLVCYSLALRHLGLSSGVEAAPNFGNTSITIVDNAAPWQVSLLNCCAHLEADLADRSSPESGV